MNKGDKSCRGFVIATTPEPASGQENLWRVVNNAIPSRWFSFVSPQRFLEGYISSMVQITIFDYLSGGSNDILEPSRGCTLGYRPSGRFEFVSSTWFVKTTPSSGGFRVGFVSGISHEWEILHSIEDWFWVPFRRLQRIPNPSGGFTLWQRPSGRYVYGFPHRGFVEPTIPSRGQQHPPEVFPVNSRERYCWRVRSSMA